VQLSGHGSSVHDAMASASGELSAVLPDGDIRKAFSQLVQPAPSSLPAPAKAAPALH
jgi:hypothetical protein